MVIIVAPHSTVYAQQYDTYYSPEKRFSIDYAVPATNSSALNITETQDNVKIDTGTMITSISIVTNPKYDDISELAVYAQKLAQNSGDHIEETVHPVFVDGSLGYSFTTTYHIAAMDGPIFHKHILTEHDGKTYTIQLQYHVSHYLLAYPEIEHTIDSIKFFD